MLTPKNGIGDLLLPRRDLVTHYCDLLLEESSKPGGRYGTVSCYWRGPKGSGKTTFLLLMGREMHDRGCQVFFGSNAADFNDIDRSFVRQLSENRSAFGDTVVVLIDEVPEGRTKGFWVQLLKECKSVIVLGVGVPALDASSPVHFERKYNPHELYIAYHFQSELSELVDELLRHFPENTREQLTPLCKDVNSFAGGHMYPTLLLCQHFLRLPDWPVHYKEMLRTSGLVNTEAYLNIKTRCFETLPDLNTFLKFLRKAPDPEDFKNFEKLGLWDGVSGRFVSPLYFNILMNSMNTSLKDIDVPMLSADATSEEKIQYIIMQGLVDMEPQDFRQPYSGGWNTEDAIGNVWAYRAKYNIGTGLYVSGQTQTARPPRKDGVVNKDGTPRKNMGGEPRVDFVFNGDMDVAVELMRTGVHKGADKAEVERHALRFGKEYKRWENSSALLIFQLTGDASHIIVPKTKVSPTTHLCMS